MSRAEARMAVQQLVYTAQAVVQERAPVRFLLDGQPTDQVLGVPVSEPMANDDETSTWRRCGSPHRRTRTPSRVATCAVTGRGAFFEATVVVAAPPRRPGRRRRRWRRRSEC